MKQITKDTVLKQENKWRPNGSICMDCGEHIYYCTCLDKPKKKV